MIVLLPITVLPSTVAPASRIVWNPIGAVAPQNSRSTSDSGQGRSMETVQTGRGPMSNSVISGLSHSITRPMASIGAPATMSLVMKVRPLTTCTLWTMIAGGGCNSLQIASMACWTVLASFRSTQSFGS